MTNYRIMEGDNLVQRKSYGFALRILGMYKYLTCQKKEYILSKQILRSGTSIGANIEEVIGGQSRRDFFPKMFIAYKEARESIFWIRLLRDGGFLEYSAAESILSDCEELCRIIGRIQLTTKKNS